MPARDHLSQQLVTLYHYSPINEQVKASIKRHGLMPWSQIAPGQRTHEHNDSVWAFDNATPIRTNETRGRVTMRVPRKDVEEQFHNGDNMVVRVNRAIKPSEIVDITESAVPVPTEEIKTRRGLRTRRVVVGYEDRAYW